MYYTYIIYSSRLDLYYKGITGDPGHRLWEHNSNLSRYTSDKGPWELVYLKEYENKHDALVEEKRLKKLNRRSVELLCREFRKTDQRNES
ncbi:MAG: GIY-YIG nuclease family protein [Lentimicrobium sp.]|nr:GIY-YIG nuclease family protein [Lentimicrobium sp.]